MFNKHAPFAPTIKHFNHNMHGIKMHLPDIDKHYLEQEFNIVNLSLITNEKWPRIDIDGISQLYTFLGLLA